MNIIGQPDVYEKPFQKWFDNNITAILDKPYAKKDREIGEVRIKWYTVEAEAEQDGEIVTVEKWNGLFWEQFNLDAHDTVQDLFDLEWKMGICGVCGQDISVNCNNANCEDRTWN